MSPEPVRAEPLHMQIAGHCKQRMLSGEIRPGQQLPSVRDLTRQWGVSQHTAQRAVEYLKTEGLARTDASGTYALGHRVKHGPQQRSRRTAYPEGERTEMRAAGIVPAPAYIVPIFGLEPGGLIIRREWRTLEWGDGEIPYMLSVTWCPPWAAKAVPELLDLWPLTDPAGAARMIADRAGYGITKGKEAREFRWIRDDGREGLLLYPGETGPHGVLAEVVLWWAGETMLEYTEHAIVRNKVIETDLLP